MHNFCVKFTLHVEFSQARDAISIKRIASLNLVSTNPLKIHSLLPMSLSNPTRTTASLNWHKYCVSIIRLTWRRLNCVISNLATKHFNSVSRHSKVGKLLKKQLIKFYERLENETSNLVRWPITYLNFSWTPVLWWWVRKKFPWKIRKRWTSRQITRPPLLTYHKN